MCAVFVHCEKQRKINCDLSCQMLNSSVSVRGVIFDTHSFLFIERFVVYLNYSVFRAGILA